MTQCSTWSFDDDTHFNNLCTNTVKKQTDVNGPGNCKVCVTPLYNPPIYDCGCSAVTRPEGWPSTMRVVFPEALVDSDPSGNDEEVHQASKSLAPPNGFTSSTYNLRDMLLTSKMYDYYHRLSVRWKPCPTQTEFVVKNRRSYSPSTTSNQNCTWSWTSATWFGKKYHGTCVTLENGGTVRLRKIGETRITNICHPTAVILKEAEEAILDHNFQEGNVDIAPFVQLSNRNYHHSVSNDAVLMFNQVNEASLINDIFKKWPAKTGDDPRRFPVEGTEGSLAYWNQMTVTGTVPPTWLNSKVHRSTEWRPLGNCGGYKIDVSVGLRITVTMTAIESWYDYVLRHNANGCFGTEATGWATWQNHPDGLFCGTTTSSNLYYVASHAATGVAVPCGPLSDSQALMGGLPSVWGQTNDSIPRPANFNPPHLTWPSPEPYAYQFNGDPLGLHSYTQNKETPWNLPSTAPGQPGYRGRFFSNRPWNHRFVYGGGMRSTTYTPPNWSPSEGALPFSKGTLCVWVSDIVNCNTTRGMVKCYKMADYRTNGSPKGSPDYPVNYEPIAGPTQFPSIIYVDVG